MSPDAHRCNLICHVAGSGPAAIERKKALQYGAFLQLYNFKKV